jgi:hypothetical protein
MKYRGRSAIGGVRKKNEIQRSSIAIKQLKN